MSRTAHRSRRSLLRLLALSPLAALVAGRADAQALPIAEVWKSPACGCCKDWIRHLEANGFKVNAFEVADAGAVRAKFGMPAKLGSCHTALIGGYVVEGHVPAREIKRALREKPQALGLTVPGMTIGSPGMDTPVYNGRQDPYDVLLVAADGSTRVYASYNKRS
jgi:hypothetical protein